MRLPPTFTSLYRLFLRTSSAAVKSRSASQNLRRLWRPTFQTASDVVAQLDDPSVPQDQQEELKQWLEIWEHRMDNTLKLLYNSAISRGLPHYLTKNLSFLMFVHRRWLMDRYYTSAGAHWNPQRPPDPNAVPTMRAKGRDERRNRWRDMDDLGWNAIEDVVKMAEGRHEISLGKVVVRGPSYRDKY